MRFKSLEWAPDRVEIVDIENKATVGCCEGPKVANVGIAAELCLETGIGNQGKVGGHHRRGAAEVAKRRVGHQPVLQLQQCGNSSPF